MSEYSEISQNTQRYNERLAEVEADRRLSEEGKEEQRKAIRKEHSERAEQLWTQANEEAQAEIESLQSKACRTSYPSHIITNSEREHYDQNVRSTRLALKNYSGQELLSTLEQSLTERDRVTAEAVYKEALHRSSQSASFTDAMGFATSESAKVVERFHQAYPDRRESYQNWRAALARDNDPVQLLLRGMHMAAGPKREASDTMGDGSAFLSDLLGNNRS